MPDRIQAQIAKVREKIEGFTGDPKDLERADKAATLDDLYEYVTFQELKSLAQVQGILSFEESQTIYRILGNTLEHFNAQPLEERVVVLQTISSISTFTYPGELLKATIRAKIQTKKGERGETLP